MTIEGGASPAESPLMTPAELNGTYRLENVNSGLLMGVADADFAALEVADQVPTYYA